MTMRCSRSPLWRNTAGLCEVQSRIYVVNRWKYYPDYFPDPLALSELVSREGARARIFQTHTSPETRHVAICDECRRKPMSVRLSCRKTCHLKCNIWIRNERVSQRGLCGLRLLDLLSGWRGRSPNKGLDLGLFLARGRPIVDFTDTDS